MQSYLRLGRRAHIGATDYWSRLIQRAWAEIKALVLDTSSLYPMGRQVWRSWVDRGSTCLGDFGIVNQKKNRRCWSMLKSTWKRWHAAAPWNCGENVLRWLVARELARATLRSISPHLACLRVKRWGIQKLKVQSVKLLVGRGHFFFLGPKCRFGLMFQVSEPVYCRRVGASTKTPVMDF